jgi:coenzyme F420-0:L-glutamate ligase/coenzyme F420-1:gamma-L-glutamate ligase
MDLTLIGIKKIPLIQEGDDLAEIIIHAAVADGINILEEDVLVIAETAVAKAEGKIIDLKSMKPSKKAFELSEKTGKEPELVEAIIRESNDIIKVGPNFIISETKHGFVCANAGIDESNVNLGLATPIPVDPDRSAMNIMNRIEDKTGNNISVIISDTQGRAFREGAVGVAIGISGLEALWDRQGEKDLYGRELQTTCIAVADELAAAASIVMGQADEGIPVVIIRGFNHFKKLRNTSTTIQTLVRPKKFDVFR